MALTTCPECGGTVSTEAKQCPHCGMMIDEEKRQKLREKRFQEALEDRSLENNCVIANYKKHRNRLILRCATLALAFLVLCIVHDVGSSDIGIIFSLAMAISFLLSILFRGGILQAFKRIAVSLLAVLFNIIGIFILVLLALAFLGPLIQSMTESSFILILCLPNSILLIRDIWYLIAHRAEYLEAREDPVTAVPISDAAIERNFSGEEDE